MLSGGMALEEAAGRRARRELSALIARAPAVAARRRGDAIENVPVGDVLPGDVVIVRAGEVLPVDGTVEAAEAVVDESALTGEPLPVTYPRGAAVRSGTANAGVGLRPARHPARRRERLRGAGAAGRAGRIAAGAVRPHGGPLRRRSSSRSPSSSPSRPGP